MAAAQAGQAVAGQATKPEKKNADGSPRRAPVAVAGLQEMLDQASTQRKAEVLAIRLALLKQQESKVINETQNSRVRLSELTVHKEKQEERIRKKEEELKRMHEADAFYVHKAEHHDHGALASQGGLPQVPEDDALAQLAVRSATQWQQGSQPGVATPRLSRSAQLPYAPGTPGAAASQTPRAATGMSSQAVGPVPQTEVSGRPSVASGQKTPRSIQSSRLQTSDVVELAHANLVARNVQANNRREKARLGCYAGQGEGNRIWMSPRTQPTNAKAPDGSIPASIAKINPKDLVVKMAKKEVELQTRLEAARKVQVEADNELANGFKTFSAMQVSARKAIREGTY